MVPAYFLMIALGIEDIWKMFIAKYDFKHLDEAKLIFLVFGLFLIEIRNIIVQ